MHKNSALFIIDNISDIVDKDFSEIDAGGKMYANMVNRVEKAVIIKALECSSGNQVEASKILGLHRNTLHSKIKKFNIDVMRFKK
jgi:two-component system nitrogen regulation response regulator GlnG